MGNAANYYNGTWITARRIGQCFCCNSDIMRGDTIKFIPNGKRALCYSCGNRHGQAPVGFVNQRLPAGPAKT